MGEALETLRARGASSEVVYLYVVEPDGRLVGVVPTRALLSARPEATLDAIMLGDVTAIPGWATVLIAAEYFVSKKYLAFPVVSGDGILLGQVDVSVFTDEVISHARRSFDDIFQIIGVHATQGRTAWTGFLDRFPWLLTNVAGGMICAWIASQYEGLLDAVVVLALFIPVVLALAESVSIQSVTLTLQGLHSSGAEGVYEPLFLRAFVPRQITVGKFHVFVMGFPWYCLPGTTCDKRPATGNVLHATDNWLRTTDNLQFKKTFIASEQFWQGIKSTGQRPRDGENICSCAGKIKGEVIEFC